MEYFLFMFPVCHPFFAALWSPAGKGLILGPHVFDASFCVLSLSHVVPWVRCGT